MALTRRDFLIASAGVTAVAAPAKRLATDWVTLGKSNVTVTRLAFGTGTNNGRVQRELGQEGFTKLVRHAYDRGIRFFETSETYPGMAEMLSSALKGLPRDSYKLMTKYGTPGSGNPAEKVDLFRKQLNTDYIDILLLHCLRPPTWQADYQHIQDAFSEAKSKKEILCHGASIHGLPALRTIPGNPWLDIAMIRMNHAGSHMDSPSASHDGASEQDHDEVVAHTKQVHAQGIGVISMKLVGEGSFTKFEDRDASMKFAMNLGCVDAVTLGFKSTDEVDEAIDRMARVMNG
jgi:aryl-alcohol dehydrogenase-like predicted oxidoreductase